MIVCRERLTRESFGQVSSTKFLDCRSCAKFQIPIHRKKNLKIFWLLREPRRIFRLFIYRE